MSHLHAACRYMTWHNKRTYVRSEQQTSTAEGLVRPQQLPRTHSSGSCKNAVDTRCRTYLQACAMSHDLDSSRHNGGCAEGLRVAASLLRCCTPVCWPPCCRCTLNIRDIQHTRPAAAVVGTAVAAACTWRAVATARPAP